MPILEFPPVVNIERRGFIFFTGNEDRLRNALPDYQARGAALVVKPNIDRLSVLIQRLVQ